MPETWSSKSLATGISGANWLTGLQGTGPTANKRFLLSDIQQYLTDGYNIEDYGAIKNGANTPEVRAANTLALETVMQLIVDNLYGFVDCPAGRYYCDNITYPEVVADISDPDTTKDIVPILWRGRTPFGHLFGSVPAPGYPDLQPFGAVFEFPNVTTGSAITIPSVTGNYDDLNYITAGWDNIEVRTHANPLVHGIDGYRCQQFIIGRLAVTTGEYSGNATLPTHNTVGIIFPKQGNGAMSCADELLVSNYGRNIYISEHTNIKHLVIQSSPVGIEAGLTGQSIYLGFVDAHMMQTIVNVTGRCNLHIAHLNHERPYPITLPMWGHLVSVITDPQNLAIGDLTFNASNWNSLNHEEYFPVVGAKNMKLRLMGTKREHWEVVGDITASDPALVMLLKVLDKAGWIKNRTSLGLTRLAQAGFYNGYAAAYYPPLNGAWTEPAQDVWTSASPRADTVLSNSTPDTNDGWFGMQYQTDAKGSSMYFGADGLGFGFLTGTGEIVRIDTGVRTNTGTMATADMWVRVSRVGTTETLETSINDGASWTVIYTFLGTYALQGSSITLELGAGPSKVYYPQGTFGYIVPSSADGNS